MRQTNYATSNPRQIGRMIQQTSSYVLLIVVAIVVFFPFIWMIATSLKPDLKAVLVTPPQLIPDPPTWSNYARAWESAPFERYAINSIFIATTVTFLQLVTSCLAAYVFARIKFRGRSALFMAYLAVMMVPVIVTIVPIYKLMTDLGWLDSYLALIVPFAANAYGIFLVRQAFLGIPNDLIDAARVDGASHWQILWSIMIPLSKSTLIIYALLAFRWRWNEYLWVIVMTSSPQMRTLPVGIVAMKTAEVGADWHILMAGVVIVLMPILILFAIAQKFFVEGIAHTGLKG